MDHNATNRFSDRVDHYIKSRPHYPDAVFDFLEAEQVFTRGSVIADMGVGTGISAVPLLQRGYTVYGVEPNTDMRLASERELQAYPAYTPLAATAEQTTLGTQSVDGILAGQAFHWFDKSLARQEFIRILKPGASVALLWNDRRTRSTDFLKVYEDFLQMFGTDYKEVDHKQTQDPVVLNAFFGEGRYHETSFYNYQDVDFAGLKSRVLSSSYMPNEGHADYDHMLYCLKKLFVRYQEHGTVRIEYDTKLYYGTLH